MYEWFDSSLKEYKKNSGHASKDICTRNNLKEFLHRIPEASQKYLNFLMRLINWMHHILAIFMCDSDAYIVQPEIWKFHASLSDIWFLFFMNSVNIKFSTLLNKPNDTFDAEKKYKLSFFLVNDLNFNLWNFILFLTYYF